MAEISRPEASYRLIPQTDGGFGVEVAIPGAYPTTVTRFATESAADNWIEDHRAKSKLPLFRSSYGSRKRPKGAIPAP